VKLALLPTYNQQPFDLAQGKPTTIFGLWKAFSDVSKNTRSLRLKS
jgi:hypothetical protein